MDINKLLPTEIYTGLLFGHQMEANKNLLVLSDRYPHLNNPVSSIFVKSQVDALSQFFTKVFVIALPPYIPKMLSCFFKYPRHKLDVFARDYKYGNVEVYYLKYFALPTKTFLYIRDFFALRTVNRWLNKKRKDIEKPYVVHAHFVYPPGTVATKLKKIYGLPVVITAHGHDIREYPNISKKMKNKIIKTLNCADAIITVSNRNKKLIRDLMGKDKQIYVIPNGYDAKIFKPINKRYARNKLNLPPEKKILLTVGSLYRVKGHRYLIESMKLITSVRNDVILVIVGDGPEKGNLSFMVKKMDLEKYVIFVGAKKHTEIPLWLNAADLFVLPSINEGNPTVMFEALGVGLPFVGTKVGGVPEIITTDEYGLLVDPGDPESLATEIIKGLERRWDRGAIISYAKQFTWDNIALKILEVYRNVTKI